MLTSLLLPVLPVVLVAALVPGQDAPNDVAIIPPEFSDMEALEEYFGHIEEHSFVLEEQSKPSQTLGELHWIEAGWNQYDIDITTLPGSESILDSRKTLAGILVTEDAVEMLYGIRLDDVRTFIDVEGVLGDAAVPSTWDEDARMVSALNQEGSQASLPPAEIIQAPGGIEVRLCLSPSARARLGIADLSDHRLREANASTHAKLSSGIWAGGFRAIDNDGDTICHIRLHTLELKRASAESGRVVVGIKSLRHAVRRLDGPVPEGSPWPDRLALSNALYQFEEAELPWWEPWTDVASEVMFKEMLTNLAGRPFSKKELHDLILETCGSIETGSLLTCRLPESAHCSVSLLGTDGHRRFSGLQLTRPENNDDQSMQVRYYFQEGAPSAEGGWCAVDSKGVNPWRENFIDYKNTLWLRPLRFNSTSSRSQTANDSVGQ